MKVTDWTNLDADGNPEESEFEVSDETEDLIRQIAEKAGLPYGPGSSKTC
jgi:hypothetical protein